MTPLTPRFISAEEYPPLLLRAFHYAARCIEQDLPDSFSDEARTLCGYLAYHLVHGLDYEGGADRPPKNTTRLTFVIDTRSRVGLWATTPQGEGHLYDLASLMVHLTVTDEAFRQFNLLLDLATDHQNYRETLSQFVAHLRSVLRTHQVLFTSPHSRWHREQLAQDVAGLEPELLRPSGSLFRFVKPPLAS